MSTVLITGGTGLIGTALTRALIKKGDQVIILTRKIPTAKQENINGKVSYALWDIEKQTLDIAALGKADYIIHLAGASVAGKRWTEKAKKEILDSRTHSSNLLVKSLAENSNRVKAVISASGIGWYGEDPSIPNPKPFREDDPPSEDFLGETCKAWEASIKPVISLGKRLVWLRTGIVISNEGGAMTEFKKPLRFGIAPILGSGKQIMSWIHIDDITGIYLYALENSTMEGAYNAVAPKPTSSKEVVLALARSVKGKFFIPIYVPSFMLQLWLGEMSVEVLKSATVSCEKIQQVGFNFHYQHIKPAMKTLGVMGNRK